MPNWTKSPDKTQSVTFLLFDRFSNLCLANCLEPMRAANTLSGQKIWSWRFVTLDGQPVRSSSDLPVLPEAALRQAPESDYLFVLSSYGFEEHDNRTTRQALRRAAGKARILVGLDTGAWLMAGAGLLSGYRATIHSDTLDRFAESFLEIDTEDRRVVQDRNRITCAGAMSAYELSLDLIRDHQGEALALEIDGLFLRRDPPHSSPGGTSGTGPGGLSGRALAVMRRNIERPLTIPQIARALSCQPKTLERRFQSALGAPPAQVYRHIRLTAARQMAENSSLSISEIALRCGYDNASALTRAFRNRYGVPPSAIRQRT